MPNSLNSRGRAIHSRTVINRTGGKPEILGPMHCLRLDLGKELHSGGACTKLLQYILPNGPEGPIQLWLVNTKDKYVFFCILCSLVMACASRVQISVLLVALTSSRSAVYIRPYRASCQLDNVIYFAGRCFYSANIILIRLYLNVCFAKYCAFSYLYEENHHHCEFY